MADLLSVAARELFRRELLPARIRWWLAAEAMCDWFGVLREGLAPHLRPRDGGADGGLREAERTVASFGETMFRRRAPRLPMPLAECDYRLFFGGLYRVARKPDAAWVFEPLGGAPRTIAEFARSERLLAPLDAEARWREITCHLGELLIATTEALPKRLPRASAILGEICFRSGVRFAQKMRKAFGMTGPSRDPAKDATEVLRMSEYLFRVNPDHWGATRPDEHTGYLEGTACPWYASPGWNNIHCGIFGQVQAGISSTFGLKYVLTSTIPKHGGHTCRIDLKPLSAASLVRNVEATAHAGGAGRGVAHGGAS